IAEGQQINLNIQAVDEFLAELRNPEQRGAVLVSRGTAVKFLMARKFDVSRAIDLFRAYRNTRLKEGICDINPDEEPLRSELLSGKFTVLPHRDAKGAALALFTARLHRPDYTTHKAVLQAIIYQLDKAIESIQTQRDGLIFIYDMTNSTYGNFDYELCVKILNLLKGAFPARLKCVFIVSSPLWFRAPFSVLRLFVREKLRERVCTVKAHELASHIPMDSLPEHLGGRSRYSHVAWIQACINSERTGVPLSPRSSAPASKDKLNANVRHHHHHPRQRQPNCQNWNGSTHGAAVVGADLGGGGDRLADHGKAGQGGSPGAKRNGLGGQSPLDWDAPPDAAPHQKVSWPPQKTPRRPSRCQDLRPAGEQAQSVHVPEHGGMAVKELLQYVKRKKKKGIYQEYEEIRKEPPAGTFEYSKKLSNQIKNRYSDVLCLDHSRVTLTTRHDTSDYINASFMDGYKRVNAYVATQGPLPKTFGDFWRMVWEQRVLIIVMTTRVVERGRVKCGQYWPLEEGSADVYGRFQVRNSRIEMFQDFKLSHLELCDSQSGERRDVAHYLYVSWPDFGVPKSASAMLDFRAQVKRHQEAAFQAMCTDWTGPAGGPPLVVHCSAGIGRTGTFCTLDICLSRLDDIGTVDVRQTVRRMRSQRAFSIQTWDQYYFCYRAVLEYAQRRGLLPPVEWSDTELETDSE
uniref:Tyrosine-protein phosphatase non-receptor type 9 n=1 Tax=Scleropages formosus TaxID=113540 RepID=A0A8C9VAC1_SCLFO